MNPRLQHIHLQLAPHRSELLNHELYHRIHSMHALRVFMEYHIFAVWDFMSLLKALQRRLTCVDVPWVASESSLGTRLVNEIVLAEESDEDGQGGFASHFDLYLRSMQQAGADTGRIDTFIERLSDCRNVTAALAADHIPEPVRAFVASTLRIAESDDLPAVAAGFLFGREDLLPDVFRRIVDELNSSAEGTLDSFRYYLDRHIELDEDAHGPMAEKLLCELCGDDTQSWIIAEEAAVQALQARLQLWNGILLDLPAVEASHASSAHAAKTVHHIRTH